MQSNSSTASASGGFFSQLGGFFLDTLDQVKDRAIDREFGEDSSERDEGPTEFGNPNTVSQPVRQSQLPGGQSLNNFAASVGVSPMILLAGGGAVLALLLVRLVKK